MKLKEIYNWLGKKALSIHRLARLSDLQGLDYMHVVLFFKQIAKDKTFFKLKCLSFLLNGWCLFIKISPLNDQTILGKTHLLQYGFDIRHVYFSDFSQ